MDNIVIVRDFPALASLPAGTILGYHHYRTPRREIIIPDRYVVEWDGRQDTQTRFTREWMATLPRVIRKREVILMAEVAQPPLYARPGYIPEAVYVDISAAYPSIYQRIGWEVEYKRGRYMSLAEPLRYPYPTSWKIGRSMPVSMTHRSWSRYWTGDKIEIRRFWTRNWNPSIRLATLDVLQAIARVAVDDFGALYYNVDGAVLPEEVADAYMMFLGDIGLAAKVKYRGAPGVVAGTHSINIGGHQIGAGMAAPKPYSNLIFDYAGAAWLLGKFERR